MSTAVLQSPHSLVQLQKALNSWVHVENIYSIVKGPGMEVF